MESLLLGLLAIATVASAAALALTYLPEAVRSVAQAHADVVAHGVARGVAEAVSLWELGAENVTVPVLIDYRWDFTVSLSEDGTLTATVRGVATGVSSLNLSGVIPPSLTVVESRLHRPGGAVVVRDGEIWIETVGGE